MLRAVSSICVESRVLELIAVSRRDAFAVFRRCLNTGTPASAQTVLSSESAQSPAQPPPPRRDQEPPPPPPPSPPPRRAWPVAALAVALTASLGGVYFYRKKSEDTSSTSTVKKKEEKEAEEEPPIPALGSMFPERVQYLVVGGGTAAFAAMRAVRSLQPAAAVLLVGDERALPYMRPPLSKELWREPDLAARAADPDKLSFRQWNGKRRPLVYEPSAFYTPVERLAAQEHGGASVARGWRVTRLDVQRHAAELRAPGQEPVTVHYDKCLVATGVRARRVPALAQAAAAGRSLALRGLRDAARLAAALDEPRMRTVAVLGGGFLATELSAALADRLRASGKRVVQVVCEGAPMAGVLPRYLADDAARRLADAGVELVTNEEVVSASLDEQARRVTLQLSSGAALEADLVVECVGSEVDASLAQASGLETHPELGGLLVNAELQARQDVWAAGDAACFYDVVLGRRRVEHHDHAVVSGRLAGENMTGAGKHYTHQSMFWSDLGPQLGYEAIGIIDSRLPTVGVFSADAVSDVGSERGEAAAAGPDGGPSARPDSGPSDADPLLQVTTTPNTADTQRAPSASSLADNSNSSNSSNSNSSRQYARGVVFYVRDQRVVGVLLWNLFNRMHVARQVLAQGEFEDLLEVGKLFAPHEED